MRRRLSLVLLACLAFALVGARRRVVLPAMPLDPHRSFAVTDQAILGSFSFERVMSAIVERSGTRTTAIRLYQQMFDTQNPRPGLAVANAPHCDDFLSEGKPAFNNLPRRCPTPEGVLATADPFAAGDHIPIAVVNRFDLAAADGSNCGQYRIIFAKKNALSMARLHFIFEAVLPNPTPQAGMAGCRAVAVFWANLSSVDSIDERRARIEKFFFTGLDGFEPVIDPNHYSPGSGGGIRTMHATTGGLTGTRFYQFRLAQHGDELLAEPDVLENLPAGRYFAATNTSPTAQKFREVFIQNIASLAIPDANLYYMKIPAEFLLGESDPGDGPLEFIYGTPFIQSTVTPEGKEFFDRVRAELTRIGSPLSPTDITLRAETQNCVGCHFLGGSVGGGVDFPRAIEGLQQVSDNFLETGEGGLRYTISPAMRDVFIPHRIKILRDFLMRGAPPVHSNGTLGGGRSVQ